MYLIGQGEPLTIFEQSDGIELYFSKICLTIEFLMIIENA